MLLEQLARDVIAAWESGDLAKAVTNMDNFLKEADQQRVDHEGTIAAAVDNYAWDDNGGISFDANPLLSVADDGVFVSAWVWVPIEADDEEPAEGTPGDSREDEDSGLPKPPPGYTAEELDRDNPYNQWMHE